MKVIRIFCMIGLAVLFLSASTTTWAQEEEPEEEEEPVQARPNPMEKATKSTDKSKKTSLQKSTSRSRQNVQATLQSKLNSMGFQTGTMKKTGKNSWSVEIKGWNSNKVSSALKGSINWDPSDRRKQKGSGNLMVEVGKDGSLTISQKSLSSMGFKANAAKLKGVANIH